MNRSIPDVLNDSLITAPDWRPTDWVDRIQGHENSTALTVQIKMLCGLYAKRGYEDHYYRGNLIPVLDDPEMKHNCRTTLFGEIDLE